MPAGVVWTFRICSFAQGRGRARAVVTGDPPADADVRLREGFKDFEVDALVLERGPPWP